MKYLYHAKKVGTEVAVVNAYREPGMERYWVASNVESADFGTKIADHFFVINTGGDVAFLNGCGCRKLDPLACPRFRSRLQLAIWRVPDVPAMVIDGLDPMPSRRRTRDDESLCWPRSEGGGVLDVAM